MTPKQQRFVDEYLRDLNATQAAIRAGYSERTANEQGAQLLRKPEILAAIDAAKTERSEQTKIDATWVLRRLVNEATADLADLYDRETGELKPVHEWPEVFRQGLVQGIEVEELFEGRGADREHVGRVRKIKLDSRIRRTELVGKHVLVNAFQEILQHKGLDGLADRLERANQRQIEALPVEPPAAPAPESDVDGLHERMRRAAAREDQEPKPVLVRPVEGVPEPKAAAQSTDWEQPARRQYSPVLPWPEEPGSASTEYDPLTE